MSLFLFTRSGNGGGGGQYFKNIVMFNQDGQQHRRHVASSGFD